jgi:hypothetical protein
MSLIEFEESKSNTLFKKLEFMKLNNLHVIRVLSTKGYKSFVHWINKIPLECLHEDCPICKDNKVIMIENPKNYYDVVGYYHKQQVFYLNVLDRTPTKVCPNCAYENTVVGNRFSPTCTGCGNFISDIVSAPINKVKILSRGKTFGDNLNSIHSDNVDDNGTPIGIQNYDIQIMVGANKQPFAQPLLHNNDVITIGDGPGKIAESELFDLESAPIKLEANEMLEFRRGISLRDIFALRANDDAMEFPIKVSEDGLGEGVLEEIEAKVQNLIG